MVLSMGPRPIRPRRRQQQRGRPGEAAPDAFDKAVAEMHDGAGIGGHVRLMGDHQDRRSAAAVEFRQQVHDLHRAPGVELSGRLVGQQHRRLRDAGSRDRNPLLKKVSAL